METKNIQQTVLLPATPEKVYAALMDETQHAAFTGFSAKIDLHEGGVFVTCGERNFGYNLRLIHPDRIIQAWSHKAFPGEHYSVVDIKLKARDAGTELKFCQFAVPADCVEWVQAGWQETYWAPLADYLQKQNEKVFTEEK
jgi:uncharacterized protein YndB with AHSA1/START domain